MTIIKNKTLINPVEVKGFSSKDLISQKSEILYD